MVGELNMDWGTELWVSSVDKLLFYVSFLSFRKSESDSVAPMNFSIKYMGVRVIYDKCFFFFLANWKKINARKDYLADFETDL